MSYRSGRSSPLGTPGEYLWAQSRILRNGLSCVSHIYLPYKTKIISLNCFKDSCSLCIYPSGYSQTWVIFSQIGWISSDPGYHIAILQQTNYSQLIIFMIHHRGNFRFRKFLNVVGNGKVWNCVITSFTKKPRI